MKKVHISDHALLRYIERKYKINFDQFRSELENIVLGAAAINAFSFHVGELKFCLAPPTKDGVVTIKTVLLRTMKQPHLAGKSKRWGGAHTKKSQIEKDKANA